MNTQKLRQRAARLLERARLIDAGEPLCYHHWSGDPGWECYCTGCGKHIEEVREIEDIPFAKDAHCYECSMTLKDGKKN